MMPTTRSLTGPGMRWLQRFALVGVATDDPDELRLQKATLTIASTLIASLAFIWVGTYLALGAPVSAAIPLAYQVVTIVGLIGFARTKDYRVLRGVQVGLMTALPFLLQWSLGGYVASSAVSLWALVAALGAVYFYSTRGAIPWFGWFVALTVLSGVIDPVLSQDPIQIPDPLRTAFFVANIAGVAVTAFALVQYGVRARDEAFARTDGLLLNILPRSIVERLKRDPGIIAEGHPDVTVLFADLVDFTPFTVRTSPDSVVRTLDRIFTAFDELARVHGVEKIKTIGDAYMAASGLPGPRVDHAEAMADMALAMQEALAGISNEDGLDLSIRIGLQSGPVIAGVIGRDKFIYDLWGDTVNTASRMESHAEAGAIQVTEAIEQRLRGRYAFEDRGLIDIKGKGPTRTFHLVGRRMLP